MKQSEKIDTIYEKIIRIEEHLKTMNGFVKDQKNINNDQQKYNKWASSQINMAKGALVLLGILLSTGIFLRFL